MEESYTFNPEIDIIEYIVYSINDYLFECVGEEHHWWLNCSYEGTSNYVCIKFLDIVIWSTEEDGREIDLDNNQYTEDLESFIKRKIIKLIEILSTITFK